MYHRSIKLTEEDIQSVLKRVNELTGIKESDTGLAPPAHWDLAADKQTLQSNLYIYLTSSSSFSSSSFSSSSSSWFSAFLSRFKLSVTLCYGQETASSFLCYWPSTCNELPVTLHFLPRNVSSFCKLLKTFLFGRSWTESASE